MRSLTPNDTTVDIYNRNVELYLQNTPEKYSSAHEPHLRWIKASLSLIPKNGSIFEIGSAHGRDARYFENSGYVVQCSDAAPNFVKYLINNGHNAIVFNAIKDQFPGEFDMIFANSVVPHFSPEELRKVLAKIKRGLKHNGLLVFNAKEGKGDHWINEKFEEKRFVHYWNPTSLKMFVEKDGYSIISFEQGVTGGDIPDHTWIQITAKKSNS